MAAWVFRSVERDAKCKVCEEKIKKGSDAISLEGAHISPKKVNLFFHVNCIREGLQTSNIDYMR